MGKQNLRFLFLGAICIVSIFLYGSWQEEHSVVDVKEQKRETKGQENTTSLASDLPASAPKVENTKKTDLFPVSERDESRIITVNTDEFNLQIDAYGGDIIFLDLPQYPQNMQNQDQGFVLLDESPQRYYIVQTGLLNIDGPDSREQGRSLYSFASNHVTMHEDESILNVDLNYKTSGGVNITKRYIFVRDSYVITIQYIIENNSSSEYLPSPYGRIKRNEPESKSGGMFGAMRHYTGAAINTPEKRYQKLPFSDMTKKPFKEEVVGGWAAMVEHYFVSALIPSSDAINFFQTEVFKDNRYGIGFVSNPSTVAPNSTETLEVRVYAGPEIAQSLKQVAPGLELTIDYGVFWFLCQPIFWLLKTIFGIFGNWGVAIILTTVVIKAAFYRFSASSYKSMGNMRKLQPKIEALKERYGDDRQRFSQAMMELYKKEKVNPLGGCLPILIQIPVFIALYYVLLEAVQLRQAPFVLWIHDLSAPDPYYVLPIIMGVSMLVQQRLNPTPPDPVQAKVMMLMPVFFTFLFLQFPSGLVLYWVVNNLLSILQQWTITRRIAQVKK